MSATIVSNETMIASIRSVGSVSVHSVDNIQRTIMNIVSTTSIVTQKGLP